MKALFEVTVGLKKQGPLGNYDQVNVIATDAISAGWRGHDKVKKSFKDTKAPQLVVNGVRLIGEID